MGLETWIGLRYLRAKKRSGFMSFISMISMVGITLGVVVLILVLSVVNGFQKEIRGQLLNIAPHAEIGYIQTEENDTWQNLQKLVVDKKGVISTAPYVAGQALLASSGEVRGAQIRGILPDMETKVVDYGNKMVSGSFNDLKDDEFGIILGSGRAESIGAEKGGKITIITPEGNVTPAGVVPRLKQFNVVGIVKTGVDEADNSLAITHLADAQKLYRLGNEGVALRLRLADPQNAPDFMSKIVPKDLLDKIWVRNWTDNNRSYFNAVEMEKRLLTLLLTCIIVVAVFNLVSSLVMAVTEKQSDIAILRTLGILGTFFGVIFGLLLAWKIGTIVSFVEQIFGVHFVASQVYFINYLPSDIQAADVIGVAVISLILSFLATIYPSLSAAKTQPAEALRYE